MQDYNAGVQCRGTTHGYNAEVQRTGTMQRYNARVQCMGTMQGFNVWSGALRVIPYLGPDLWLGIHKMLKSDCGVWGQASVSNHPQREGIGLRSCPRG